MKGLSVKLSNETPAFHRAMLAATVMIFLQLTGAIPSRFSVCHDPLPLDMRRSNRLFPFSQYNIRTTFTSRFGDL